MDKATNDKGEKSQYCTVEMEFLVEYNFLTFPNPSLKKTLIMKS